MEVEWEESRRGRGTNGREGRGRWEEGEERKVPERGRWKEGVDKGREMWEGGVRKGKGVRGSGEKMGCRGRKREGRGR